MLSQDQATALRAARLVVVASPSPWPKGDNVVHVGGDGWPEQLADAFARCVHQANHPVAVVHDQDPTPAWAELLGQVMTELRACYARVTMGEATIATVGADMLRNLIATLLRSPRWLRAHPAQPYHGMPGFVVAAGPSLDRNIAELHAASRRGPIFAVNAAAPALLARGIRPTAAVWVEAIDVAHANRELPADLPVLLESRAHPRNWAAAGNPIAFLDGELCCSRMALELGITPTPYSTTVAGAAASIALQLGCSPIVLVGQDLGYPAGRMYAEGTGREGGTATLVDGGAVAFEGAFGYDRMQVRYRQAWGGGPDDLVVSTHEFDQMARWYERVAERHPIVNATEGGTRIAGTREARLRDVLAELPERDVPGFTFGQQRDTGATIDRLRRACERVVSEGGDLPPEDAPELNLWVVGAVQRAKTRPRSERVEIARAATREAAEEVIKMLATVEQ